MVLTGVSCLYSNQTMIEKHPKVGFQVDLTDSKNVHQQPCKIKNLKQSGSLLCIWVHI